MDWFHPLCTCMSIQHLSAIGDSYLSSYVVNNPTVMTCSATCSFPNYHSNSYWNHRHQEGVSHLQRHSNVACFHHPYDSSAHSYSSPIIHWRSAYWYCPTATDIFTSVYWYHLMAADIFTLAYWYTLTQMLHIYSYTYHLTILLMRMDHDPQYINPCTYRVDSQLRSLVTSLEIELQAPPKQLTPNCWAPVPN